MWAIYALVQQVYNKLISVPVSPIRSIQRGTATINSGTYTLDITIAPVTTSKSFIRFSHKGSANGTVDTNNMMGTLTSSTTIRFQHSTLNGSFNVSWEAIEYN